MINLSYKYDQNSSSIEIGGMPDVSNGDSDQTIGIISSWTLQIIGSPLLEGKKDHLDNLMQVVLQYSRSYISGIRKTFISNKNIVTISPIGKKHKLLLNSTKKDVKPLEIILDDSELSDLTCCLDLVRFDQRINIKWNIIIDRPYNRRYIINNTKKTSNHLNFIYAFIIFIICSAILIFIPINYTNENIERNTNKTFYPDENK
tara:strand:- start:1086 stop:1694 length:609 start_codon:yes stop_codon:yes gene_type:complete